MKDHPNLYILTYDHGGFVLWKDKVETTLREHIGWLEQYPGFKFGLDYEAFTFDELSKTNPEIMDLIRDALSKYPGRFGLGSTTYGQPLALFISGESNVRQLTYAIRANRKHFGQTPPVYAISEFALISQSPQLLNLCGFEAAILRTHVMNYGYQRTFDAAFGSWIGKDGSAIPAVPAYDDEGRGFCNTTLDNWILSRWPDDTAISLEDFEAQFRKYQPLLASRYDDLTQPYENVVADAVQHKDWAFVLLEELPGIYGEAAEPLVMTDNDFHGKIPWGYCGNEIFNGCRSAEVHAALAERLNALAVLLGGTSAQEQLEAAWQNVLVAQHHDITICGLLDLAHRFLPASQQAAQEADAISASTFASRFADPHADGVLAVNLNSFPVSAWIETPANGCSTAFDGDCAVPSELSDGMLRMLVQLNPLEAKRLLLKQAPQQAAGSAFRWEASTGMLTTPLYRIHLTRQGIASIDSAVTGQRFVDNGSGKLFRGYIEDVDCMNDFDSDWAVTVSAHMASAVKTGFVGSIPFRFEMCLMEGVARIDCSVSFELHGERVGRTGITKGIGSDFNVNGSVHEEKLRFVLDACLSEDRRMLRDAPFSIAEWDGQVCKPEDFWMDGAKILADTPVSPAESFQSVTYLQGLYWVALRDAAQGIAVFNRGCMGASVEGNELSVPLIYANEYPCGTRMLNGTFSSAFAIYPFEASISDVSVHRAALAYAYPPAAIALQAGFGDLTRQSFAEWTSDQESVILTALYPEDGAIYARFCNYADLEASVEFSPAFSRVTAEVNLLGETLACCGSQLHFRPWEIKTARITL